ncbi:MAG: SpoIIE family protein phosphatase [Candidatus Sumerlaeota bacterium]|nr:SpoIIE family protein phosphatase [Candidatus Sumerlaeota bacterium]
MKEKKIGAFCAEPCLEKMLFQEMMNYISDAVYFKDLNSRIITVSKALANMWGVDDPSQAQGKTDFDFFAEEHARQAFEDEQEIIRTGQGKPNIEEKETWPDGRTTWASTTKMPLRDDQGNIMGTFGISRNITQRIIMEEALRRSEEKIRIQHEMLQQDLERARKIQAALLPAHPPMHERLRMDYRHLPFESVGGDFFSYAHLPGGGMGAFLGDLTGHGVSAALFMALIKFLSDQLSVVCGYNPKAYLESLNDKLMNQMPSAFLTGVYGFFRFDPSGPGAKFVCAGAGHPLPILERAATHQVEMIPTKSNAALGLIMEFDTTVVETLLAPKDRIYLYTDGITETINSQDEFLGENALLAMVRRAGGMPLSDALDAIMAEVHHFRGSMERHDDIVLMGFEAL